MLPGFLARAIYRHAVGTVRWTVPGVFAMLKYRKRTKPKLGSLCSRYLVSWPGQAIVLPSQVSGGHLQAKKNLHISVEVCVRVTYFLG